MDTPLIFILAQLIDCDFFDVSGHFLNLFYLLALLFGQSTSVLRGGGHALCNTYMCVCYVNTMLGGHSQKHSLGNFAFGCLSRYVRGSAGGQLSERDGRVKLKTCPVAFLKEFHRH